MVDVDINDKICIHADGGVLTVHASDVVESVRQFQHLQQEIERLRDLHRIPCLGTVQPDGSVKFRDGPLDTESPDRPY